MAATMLVCKQCNFENEPERVYCHNCGAKLDRSLLPAEASKREDPAVVQERVRRIVKPRNISLQIQLKNFLYCVLLSAVLAAIVVILKPPAWQPHLNPDAVMDAPAITDDLEADLASPTPRRRVYTEDQINAYLQSSLRSGKDGKVDKAGGIPLFSFERAYVHLEEGKLYLTMQDSVFGLPLYATTARTLSVQKGALASQALGGRLGRLPIPAAVTPAFEAVFSPLKKAAARPLQMLGKMQVINVHKGSVELVTSGAR